MCQIIVKPLGQKIQDLEKKLDTFNQYNGDGIGVYSIHKNSKATAFNLHKFLPNEAAKAKVMITNMNKPAYLLIIHFRLSTSGKKDKVNIHPFEISKGLYLFHNGIISNLNGQSKDFSDTALYANFLSLYEPAYLMNPRLNGFKRFFELLDSYNKLVLVNGKDYIIVNEKAGKWSGGAWYSNIGNLTACEYKAPAKYDEIYNSVHYGYNRPYYKRNWDESNYF